MTNTNNFTNEYPYEYEERFFYNFYENTVSWIYHTWFYPHDPNEAVEEFVVNVFHISVLEKAIDEADGNIEYLYELLESYSTQWHYAIYDDGYENARDEYLSSCHVAEGFTEDTIKELLACRDAAKAIDEYSLREFDDIADFDDPKKVGMCYTTAGGENDEDHEIQVSVNLIDHEVLTYIDDRLVDTEQYSSMRSLVDEYLKWVTFDSIYSDALDFIDDDNEVDISDSEDSISSDPSEELVEQCAEKLAKECGELVDIMGDIEGEVAASISCILEKFSYELRLNQSDVEKILGSKREKLESILTIDISNAIWKALWISRFGFIPPQE